MVVKVYGIDGSEQRDIELADEVFNRSISTGSIYHAIRNELANLRVGTASTKTRSEVRGSGAKPWRQKGTGRARAGTRQSPLWVGGGVVFGPKPRDYSYKIPKKLKRLAYKSIFSQKTQEQRLMVVEDFTVESGKTRELVKILKGLTPENRTTIVISGEDSMLKRAGRNVPGLSILSYNRLRAHDLFYAGRVIIFEKAAGELARLYGEPSSRRRTGKPAAGAPVGAKPVPAAQVKEVAKPKPAAKPKSKPAVKTAEKPRPAAPKPAAAKAAAKAKSAAKPKPAAKAKTAAKPKPAAKAKAAAKPKPAAKAKPAARTPEKPRPAAPKAAAKPKTEAKPKPKSKASPSKKSKEGA
ncbi:MAG: 50S ribosomal protein L4 [Spirochaetaceae bacterium]|nr:MAG: 50S ribosomal protein L4 [Spirochaetaceae bacterium]